MNSRSFCVVFVFVWSFVLRFWCCFKVRPGVRKTEGFLKEAEESQRLVRYPAEKKGQSGINQVDGSFPLFNSSFILLVIPPLTSGHVTLQWWTLQELFSRSFPCPPLGKVMIGYSSRGLILGLWNASWFLVEVEGFFDPRWLFLTNRTSGLESSLFKGPLVFLWPWWHLHQWLKGRGKDKPVWEKTQKSLLIFKNFR